jgi:hypothetical protein
MQHSPTGKSLAAVAAGPARLAVCRRPKSSARLAVSPAEERPRLRSGRRWSGRWPRQDEVVSAAAAMCTAAILGRGGGVEVRGRRGRGGYDAGSGVGEGIAIGTGVRACVRSGSFFFFFERVGMIRD